MKRSVCKLCVAGMIGSSLIAAYAFGSDTPWLYSAAWAIMVFTAPVEVSVS
jgi:hypothetical protein